MAGRDYILCRDCGDKLIYDGSDNVRSRLEEYYGDPSACDWTVELVCPPCLKKIEDKQAEPVAWVGLTDKDRLDIYGQASTDEVDFYARAIEAALKEKNAKPVQAEPVDIKALAAKAGLPLAWISETGVIQWSQLERLVALARQQAEPVGDEAARLLTVCEIQDATIKALTAQRQAEPVSAPPKSFRVGYMTGYADGQRELREKQQAEPVKGESK